MWANSSSPSACLQQNWPAPFGGGIIGTRTGEIIAQMGTLRLRGRKWKNSGSYPYKRCSGAGVELCVSELEDMIRLTP